MTCNLVLRYSYVAHIIIWKIRGELQPADGLFTGALKEVFQFDNLLRKVGGNPSMAERLIEYERGQRPGATRLTCLQNAIQRWEQENG